MSEHVHERDRHHEALEAILLGGNPLSELKESPQRDCPICRERIEALMDIGNKLDRVAAREREELEQADMQPLAPRGPAEEALLASLRGSAGEVEAQRERRHVLTLLVTAAAASLVLWLTLREPKQESDESQILGGGLELLSPVGTVDAFGAFTWSHEKLGEGWYKVTVRSLDAPPGSEPTVSKSLRESEWKPDPEVIEGWGKRILWTVDVYSGAGGDDRANSGSAQAQLR